METNVYKYYSTQRPVDIGTFPKPAHNAPVEIINYDERIPMEDGAFLAWGELHYTRPLTDGEISGYELRPSRDNVGLREILWAQAQTVGPWEVYRRVPEEKRVTEYDSAHAVFIPRDGVIPLRMNAQYNSALKYPVPKIHPSKHKNTPRHRER